MKLAIYTNPTSSYGILVIIEHFIKVSREMGIPCRHITSLSDALPDEVVLPYGTLEPVSMIKLGNIPVIALLVDAISLGAKNKLKHYTCVGHVWHKDYMSTLLKFLKWHFLDKKIANNVPNIILVSETDGLYLQGFNPKVNILVCPNGANEAVVKPHIHSDKLRLGILSSWGNENTYEENNWFIRKYYLKYAKEHPEAELVVAGRGKLIERLRELPQVRVMGAVDDLADFFADIDIFVGANPKGCGILNRCLDAFAYQVPVIGCSGAFSGFCYMNNAFLTFDNYQEFIGVVERLKGNKQLQEELVKNALKEIKEHNNWEKNLGNLLEQIQTIIESERKSKCE